MNTQPGDRVRVVVRSFLYATAEQPASEWTGTVSKVE